MIWKIKNRELIIDWDKDLLLRMKDNIYLALIKEILN